MAAVTVAGRPRTAGPGLRKESPLAELIAGAGLVGQGAARPAPAGGAKQGRKKARPGSAHPRLQGGGKAVSFGEVRADDEAEALRQRIAQLRKQVADLEGQVRLGREEREALQRLLAAKAAPDPQAEQELLAKKLQKRDMLVKKLEVSVSGAETEKRKMLEKIKAQNAELARVRRALEERQKEVKEVRGRREAEKEKAKDKQKRLQEELKRARVDGELAFKKASEDVMAARRRDKMENASLREAGAKQQKRISELEGDLSQTREEALSALRRHDRELSEANRRLQEAEFQNNNRDLMSSQLATASKQLEEHQASYSEVMRALKDSEVARATAEANYAQQLLALEEKVGTCEATVNTSLVDFEDLRRGLVAECAERGHEHYVAAVSGEAEGEGGDDRDRKGRKKRGGDAALDAGALLQKNQALAEENVDLLLQLSELRQSAEGAAQSAEETHSQKAVARAHAARDRTIVGEAGSSFAAIERAHALGRGAADNLKLRAALTAIEAEFTVMRESHRSKSAALSSIQEELNATNEHSRELFTDVGSLNREVRELKERLRHQQAEWHSPDAFRDVQARVVDLEAALAKAKESVQRKATAYGAAKREKERVEGLLRGQLDKNTQLVDENMEHSRDLGKKEILIGNLRQQIAQLRAKVGGGDALLQAQSELGQQAITLKSDLVKENDVPPSQYQIEAFKKAVTEADTLRTTLDKFKHQSRNQKLLADQEIRQLNSQIAMMRDDICTELEAKEAENRALAEGAAGLQDRLKALAAAYAAQKGEVEQAAAVAERAVRDAEKHKSQLEYLRSWNKDMLRKEDAEAQRKQKQRAKLRDCVAFSINCS